jgi:hypothetical protein
MVLSHMNWPATTGRASPIGRDVEQVWRLERAADVCAIWSPWGWAVSCLTHLPMSHSGCSDPLPPGRGCAGRLPRARAGAPMIARSRVGRDSMLSQGRRPAACRLLRTSGPSPSRRPRPRSALTGARKISTAQRPSGSTACCSWRAKAPPPGRRPVCGHVPDQRLRPSLGEGSVAAVRRPGTQG